MVAPGKLAASTNVPPSGSVSRSAWISRQVSQIFAASETASTRSRFSRARLDDARIYRLAK